MLVEAPLPDRRQADLSIHVSSMLDLWPRNQR